jgi:hypothetical protein
VVYYNVTVNIPTCYSNSTIVNMYWHCRKLVYKIIVNGGGYRITYSVAGCRVYSLSLYIYKERVKLKDKTHAMYRDQILARFLLASFLFTRYTPVRCIRIIIFLDWTLLFGCRRVSSEDFILDARIRRRHVDPVFVLEPGRIRTHELRGGWFVSGVDIWAGARFDITG